MKALIPYLAGINATLNSLAAICIVLGMYFIRRGERIRHQRSMVAAAGFSALFLFFYLARIYYKGTTFFPGTGLAKAVYLLVLVSHVILAMVVTPMVLISIYRGFTRRYRAHKKIARLTYPMWLYVSVTGVMVYIMLYQIKWV